ncbi:MAG: hypothetical protein KY461_09575 [Actinobacteria bacterium]|nr:hypothetical protein [Actinomycetota bacterium]
MTTRTVYYTATTLDGFIADEHDSLDWLFEVPSGDASGPAGFGDFFAGIGAAAMGRTTYEWVHAHEGLDEHPEAWDASFGGIPVWVFTHHDLPGVAGADIRFVQGDVAPVHAEMAAAAGDRGIWLVGGGDLVYDVSTPEDEERVPRSPAQRLS